MKKLPFYFLARNLEKFVEPKFGNRQIGSITRSDVKAWIADGTSTTGKRASASRMRKATFLLYGILNHAVELELLGKVSLGKTKGLIPKLNEQKKHQVISNEELQRLASSAGDYGLLILVAGTVGLRWAELVALTPEDFDFKLKTISVSKSLSEVNGSFELVSTKSGKPREVPIPDSLQRELKLKVVSTPAGKNVFSSSKGDYLRSSNFARRVFKPALKKAGLPDMRFHDLRHSASWISSRLVTLGPVKVNRKSRFPYRLQEINLQCETRCIQRLL